MHSCKGVAVKHVCSEDVHSEEMAFCEAGGVDELHFPQITYSHLITQDAHAAKKAATARAWLAHQEVQHAVPERLAAGGPVAGAQAAPDQAVLQRLQLLQQALRACSWHRQTVKTALCRPLSHV